MVNAVVLEVVEPMQYTSSSSRPSNTVVHKSIHESFRPWIPGKFISLSQVQAFAQLSELSYYRRGDAVYVVMNDEWFVHIYMYGRIWSRPAIRVREPSLDVQRFAPIGHCVCEHCGAVDVVDKYDIVTCLGNSYRLCKKHIKSGTLDYIRSKYKVEVISG